MNATCCARSKPKSRGFKRTGGALLARQESAEELIQSAQSIYSRRPGLSLDQIEGFLREDMRSRFLLTVKIERDFDRQRRCGPVDLDAFVDRMMMEYWAYARTLRSAEIDSPGRLRLTGELKERLMRREDGAHPESP